MVYPSPYRKWLTRFCLVLVMLALQPWLLSGSMSAVLAQATTADHTPVRLRIPNIGVDTAVESVGKTEAGEVGVPQDSKNAAWYNLGITPGEQGNAVIAGHLDNKTGRAVFWRLRELKVDDTITIVDAEGEERTFAVIEVAVYPYDKAPINKIFGFDLERDLNLITCTGRWNSKTHTYSQRLVVYTRLIN